MWNQKTPQNTFVLLLFTFRPARLLCRFIRLLASPSISRASKNFRANFMPKLMSAEQPPHFHACWCCSNCSRYGKCLRCVESQPHSDILPRAHADVIACTAPALDIAYVNAASREPACRNGRKKEKWKIEVCRKGERESVWERRGVAIIVAKRNCVPQNVNYVHAKFGRSWQYPTSINGRKKSVVNSKWIIYHDFTASVRIYTMNWRAAEHQLNHVKYKFTIPPCIGAWVWGNKAANAIRIAVSIMDLRLPSKRPLTRHTQHTWTAIR